MNLKQLEENLNKEAGSYILVLKAEARSEVEVGSAGLLTIEPGYYLYLGSARGPGGVVARVGHHYRQTANPHWHIDYLRAETELVDVWYIYSQQSYEHSWADYFLAQEETKIPLGGFGASDCDCQSHLFFFVNCQSLAEFKQQFEETEIYSIGGL